MKLIIDIDEDDYKEVKEYGINTFPSLAITIKNGTSLDDLKAEIEHVKDNLLFGMVSNDTMLEVILEIIDKYKAERSE